MADKARILFTGLNSAFFNMGLDEAILESVAAGSCPPTLRFYGWTPSAISLGYFQGIHEEVDTQACREKGVDIVRRITGGGAVFHDTEVTYSIVIPEGHRLAPDSITDSYAILCAGIVEGLAILGVGSEFVPINDIVSAVFYSTVLFSWMWTWKRCSPSSWCPKRRRRESLSRTLKPGWDRSRPFWAGP